MQFLNNFCMIMAANRRQRPIVEKVETARSCLEAAFMEIREERSSDLQRFVFNDRGQRSELLFTRAFLDHIHLEQLAWFRAYLTSQVIPLVKANAGKRIFISDRGIDISERASP